MFNAIYDTMHARSSNSIQHDGADPVSRLFAGLKVDGFDHGRRHLEGSWAFSLPSIDRAYFHLVTGAAIWIRIDGGWSRLDAGDAILLPRGDAHLIASSPEALSEPCPVWQCRPLSEDAEESERSEQGGSMLFYGSMRFNLAPSHPMFSPMPVAVRASSLMWCEPSIVPILDAVARELTIPRAGAAGMAARLADLLAMQIIRSWVENAGEDELGWISAARHPQIGPVLATMQASPEDEWSVDRMAKVAGMSRSGFAAAFHATVGATPARYLTELRMHRARRWLSDEGSRVSQVATRIGYESEASFSRAFKRVMGMSPSEVSLRRSG